MATNALRPRPNATHASATRVHVKPAPAGLPPPPLFSGGFDFFVFSPLSSGQTWRDSSLVRRAFRALTAESGVSQEKSRRRRLISLRVSRKARSRRERAAGAVASDAHAASFVAIVWRTDDMTDPIKLWANKKERQQYGTSFASSLHARRSSRALSNNSPNNSASSRGSRD